jgi:hypothetical protein
LTSPAQEILTAMAEASMITVILEESPTGQGALALSGVSPA